MISPAGSPCSGSGPPNATCSAAAVVRGATGRSREPGAVLDRELRRAAQQVRGPRVRISRPRLGVAGLCACSSASSCDVSSIIAAARAPVHPGGEELGIDAGPVVRRPPPRHVGSLEDRREPGRVGRDHRPERHPPTVDLRHPPVGTCSGSDAASALVRWTVPGACSGGA